MPPTSEFRALLADADATEALGRRLGGLLRPGSIVALIGPLGAGKTTLVRGIAAGLGHDDPGRVSSPTFTLIHEYAARLPIVHFDAYRLKRPAEFADLGAAELLAGGNVCLIEWADRVQHLLPRDRLEIRLDHAEGGGRAVAIAASGPLHEPIVAALCGQSSGLE